MLLFSSLHNICLEAYSFHIQPTALIATFNFRLHRIDPQLGYLFVRVRVVRGSVPKNSPSFIPSCCPPLDYTKESKKSFDHDDG